MLLIDLESNSQPLVLPFCFQACSQRGLVCPGLHELSCPDFPRHDGLEPCKTTSPNKSALLEAIGYCGPKDVQLTNTGPTEEGFAMTNLDHVAKTLKLVFRVSLEKFGDVGSRSHRMT